VHLQTDTLVQKFRSARDALDEKMKHFQKQKLGWRSDTYVCDTGGARC
jgi:hypothetical protein